MARWLRYRTKKSSTLSALNDWIMRNNELSKQILKEAEERFKNKNMKAEIEITAPVLPEEKMIEYLMLFARMLLIAEGETVSIKIDGQEVYPLYT